MVKLLSFKCDTCNKVWDNLKLVQGNLGKNLYYGKAQEHRLDQANDLCYDCQEIVRKASDEASLKAKETALQQIRAGVK